MDGSAESVGAAIVAGGFAIAGVLLGQYLQRSFGHADEERRWHRERLVQIYTDCLYHSWRVSSSLAAKEPPEWDLIREDVAETLRATLLLVAYLSKANWEKMSGLAVTIRSYSRFYARDATESRAKKLQDAVEEIHHLAASLYKFDDRVFPADAQTSWRR